MLATSILALAIVGSAHARAAAQQADPKSIGCRLTLSIDLSMQDRWYHSPGEEGLDLAEAKQVVRGQPFAIYVFFKNWTENDRGEIGVDYDVRITRPDGGLYRAEEKLEAHSGTGTPDSLLMADQFVTPQFGADDALGTYVVTVTIRDRASGTRHVTKKSLDLVEYAEGPGVEDVAAFEAWMRAYHRAPQPERAIAVFLDLGRAGLWKDEAASAQAAAFFDAVFAGNAWLFPFLQKRLDTQDADTKRAILRLLARSTYDGAAFTSALTGEQAETWKQVSAEPRRDLFYDPITQASHIDALWAAFYATGRFAPVLRVCEALAPEETQVIPAIPEREKLKLAAAASLAENARRLELVRNYAKWITTSETIPEAVASAVQHALTPR